MTPNISVPVYLDIFAGDKEAHARQEESYNSTSQFLLSCSEKYSLPNFPSQPEDLSEEQQETLKDLDHTGSINFRFTPPEPICIGRFVFELFGDAYLKKTRENFTALCTGEKGDCKNAPNKKLHFLQSPIHRIVKYFIAQGGDITRGTGAGGESIYGDKFVDERPPKGTPARKASAGSLAMAHRGKNSNTSQFFIVLTDDTTKLKKLDADKPVIFGHLKQDARSQGLLKQLSDLASGSSSEEPSMPVWIGGCGKL
ncbi:hypothetical protein CONPUDRAFT_118722, partial [Coniophora puteana RWD-64-598 SS2]